MDTDAFRNKNLSHLDFQSPQDFSQIPKEILKSSTVENLISQNEDLMARLKVTLRRLSILETDNQKLSDEANKARMSQASVKDQILIWKEKDALWKTKIDQIERDRDVYLEKSKALEEKVNSLSSDLSRHQKYHDRIKNQVKPYVSQLKEYSLLQENKVAELEVQLSQKEAQLRDIRHQIVEVSKNSIYQIETQEKKSKEMIDFYETQLQNLNKELQFLHQTQEELEIKNLKLHSTLERLDTLENENIALRNSKEEMKARFDSDISEQQERLSELIKQNQKLGVEHADLQIRVLEDQAHIKKLEQENRQYVEQLEGLRFMWTAKTEENEKLKAASASLERINLELSQKLNDYRK